VQKGIGNGQIAALSKVMKLNDIRPAGERNANNRQPQSRTVSPASQIQTPQPQVVKPSDNKGRIQQPRAVTLPKRVQSPQSRNINPSNGRGKEKQPQNVVPPNQNRKEQPEQSNVRREEKEKRER
jgi:hypothetical protein